MSISYAVHMNEGFTIRELLVFIASCGHTSLTLDEVAVHVELQKLGLENGLLAKVVQEKS